LLAEQLLFFRRLRVADQEGGSAPEGDTQDQGVVVRVGEGNRVRAGSEHFDHRAAKGTRAAERGRPANGNAPLAEKGEDAGVPRASPFSLPLSGVPKLSHANGLERADEPTVVIGVGMRQRNDGELAPAARAQEGRDDDFTGVDGTAHQAAGVDEHGRSVGKIDQRRVPLSYVEHGHPKATARRTGANLSQLRSEPHGRAHQREPGAPCRGRRPASRCSGPENRALPVRGTRHRQHEPTRSFRNPRKAPHQEQTARRHHRRSSLDVGQSRQQHVREAERKGHHLAERHGHDVGKHTAERQGW
jgi:hypothetical protein